MCGGWKENLFMRTKIVYVVWFDAVSVDDWTDVSEIRPELAEIHSAGLLVGETKDILSLAVNKDITNDKVSCIMNIPKKWIKVRHRILV